jgi:hypothetical protein
VYAILHRAGPRSRQLCRLLRELYGPLARLTPRGLETEDELLSALAGSDRHTQLTSLDLGNLHFMITTDALTALCKALPNLTTLRLTHEERMHRGGRELTAAAVAAATSCLSRLTALHVPFVADAAADIPPEWPDKGCGRLQELTLPRDFPAPSLARLSHLTGLTRLGFAERYPAIDVAHVASLVAQLPALVALELGGELDPVAPVQRLTQLTALTLDGSVLEEATQTGELLRHVGALTNLCRLELRLWWHEGDAGAPGWLTRLTRLRVDFAILEGDPEEVNGGVPDGFLAFADVASSVPNLPALRELRIARMGPECYMLPAAACASIASCSSSLESLSLDRLRLPASMLEGVIPQLTGLTHLGIDLLTTDAAPSAESFTRWPVLTNLRELRCTAGTAAGDMVPCQLLAGLPHLDTLSLGVAFTKLNGPYVEHLCHSMPRLTSLDLSRNSTVGTGLSALRHLTNLEVLSLGRAPCIEGDLEHVQAPPSLRRCYLGGYWDPEQQTKARAVLGRQVDVVFPDRQERRRY